MFKGEVAGDVKTLTLLRSYRFIFRKHRYFTDSLLINYNSNDSKGCVL